MNTQYQLIAALLCLVTMSFSPLAAADNGPRTGPTFSYYVGSSKLQNSSAYNSPISGGYQLGYQGRYLGVTVGQNQLGRFVGTGATPSHVDAMANEALVNFRMYADYASLFIYAGLADWKLKSTNILVTKTSSGTSPVLGLGIKLGNTIGLLMTAMYYKSIADSDVVSMNVGFNF